MTPLETQNSASPVDLLNSLSVELQLYILFSMF